jgi:hypothetical protein
LALVAPDDVKPVFAWEPFKKIARELPELFKRHALDAPSITGAKPDPDWDRFYQYALYGGLHCLTIRAGGFLVGYLFVFVGPNPKYLTETWSTLDGFWIDPLYRDAGCILGMFSRYDQKMKELKVRGGRLGDLLEQVGDDAYRARLHKVFVRLGYVPREMIYEKDYGDERR